MVSAGTLYLTQSKHGIWYYQRWIPLSFRKKNPTLNSVFRVSLRTRNKQDALRLSRLLSVKIDKLALKYFDSPEQFGKAMTLLAQSAKALEKYPNDFQAYEEGFLSHLDDGEDWLHSKAENFTQTITAKFQNLHEEIEFLRQALINTSSVSTPEDREEFIAKIKETLHPTLSDEQNPTLEELFDKWKDANADNLTPRSIKETYTPAIDLFIRIINDYNGGSIRINELNAQHITHYQTTYKAIPSRTTTRDKNISGLVKLKGKRKSPKTILDNFTNIGTFLNWILTKAFPIDANLHRVMTKGSDVRPDDKFKKQRQPLSDTDLHRLFNSEKYIQTGKFKTSGMYWAPLIALFTGARMTEILQLEKHDIYKVEDTWVFRFDDVDYKTQDEYKHIKKDGSRREVPIHKKLLELQFINYINSIESRVFPDEPRSSNNGKFDAFPKRFKTYREQVGVKPDHDMNLKDFHSIRHTVETQLNEVRTTGRASEMFDEGIVDAIIGHASSSRSIGQKVYNHSQYIHAKSKALDRLRYKCIDFSKIMNWDKCEFSRKPHRERAAENLKIKQTNKP